MHKTRHWSLIATLVASAASAAPGVASAAVIGFLGNFDVINDTGGTAHGFEIELEGLHSSDITDTFGGAGRGFPSGRGFDPNIAVQRYGAPTVSEYNDVNGTFVGTKVTYTGLFDPSSRQWDFGTPSVGNGVFATPGDNCWTGGGVGYGAGTPCDHFGVGTTQNPTRTTYNWLLETGTPGTLTNGLATLPAPVWTVSPPPPPVVDPALPPPPPAPPIVAALIKAPDPIDSFDFGAALWVKIYTTELDRPVGLEELIGGNPVVDQAKTEVEWQLLQVELGNALSGFIENEKQAGANAESVIRRYEFFKYSGEYDGQSHEANLDRGIDPLGRLYGDSNPAPTDVGTYLGAQNGAVNLGDVSPVPLPVPLLMFAPALAGLVFKRRRA